MEYRWKDTIQIQVADGVVSSHHIQNTLQPSVSNHLICTARQSGKGNDRPVSRGGNTKPKECHTRQFDCVQRAVTEH